MKQGNQRWRICFEPVLKAWDEGGCVKEVRGQPTATCPEDVESLLSWMTLAEQEIVVGVYLDFKNKILGHEIIHVGGVGCSVVSPQDVFKPAILYSAGSIILAHNHPTGVATPSIEDIDVTRRIKEVGEIMNIPLVDHLIMGRKGNYSFREQGFI